MASLGFKGKEEEDTGIQKQHAIQELALLLAFVPFSPSPILDFF